MTAFNIVNFGGEQPSVSPRAIQAPFAQKNRNLLLTTAEFRPLSTDRDVADVPAGTNTIYRFSRDVTGAFNATPGTNWITSTELRSYVKGQVNDERTERTYYTNDMGTSRPRAVDNNGQDRLLGVPRPGPVGVTPNITDEFTPEEANTFVYGDLPAAVLIAAKESILPLPEPQSRRNGSTIFAGPYSTHGMTFAADYASMSYAHWAMVASISTARAADLGITPTVLAARENGGTFLVPITCLPIVLKPDPATLTAKLLAIKYPESAGATLAGTSVYTPTTAAEMVALVSERFDTTKTSKSLRDELDGAVAEFVQVLSGVDVPARPSAPVEPTKPTVPQFTTALEGGNEITVEAPAWIAYGEAMRVYREANKAYTASQVDYNAAKSSVIGRLADLQLKADRVTKQIEAEQEAGRTSITNNDTTAINGWIDGQGGVVGLLGEGAVTERIVETRFYVATFVTDWGEESAPSPVSDQLEIDQNDTVTIQRPGTSTGESFESRNIKQWRLYRSNAGAETAAFQFVGEAQIAEGAFTDEVKAAALGEVCPTITWEQPPYRMDAQFAGFVKPVVGTNPFLRGLVGMPNGIMAGFIDNTVAFCEPYHAYAWPVEYQIVTEYPIVGLGVFGQTLFVGTTGNPYFITGADSASMSAIKLDNPQSCASARSIVGTEGGVLFVSPDGLCLASPNGVSVVSAAAFTREDWQGLNPATTVAAWHEGTYYLFHNQGAADAGCLTFNLTLNKIGRVDLAADALFTDTLTDTLYAARGGHIAACFGGTARRSAAWRTPLTTLPLQQPFAWLKVYGDQTVSDPVTVRWYGDGVLRHTATVTDLKPQRLPPGRWLEHEVEVESTGRVTRVMLAGNTDDLKAT